MSRNTRIVFNLVVGAMAASVCFGCSQRQSTQVTPPTDSQQLVPQQDVARQTQIANIEKNPNIAPADKQQILQSMGALPK
jgi:hypothetical protein